MGEELKEYDVQATVISQTGFCRVGHRAGDEFLIGLTTPEGICCSAFGGLYHSIKVLRFDGVFPGQNPHAITLSCPNAENPVVFRLTKLR